MNNEDKISALDKEIEKELLKVASRERVLERYDQRTHGQIKLFTILAWILTVSGFIIVGYGLYKSGDQEGQLSLNEFGDFLSGTLASAWALAGIFFIYVSFLGQRLELKQNKIDMLYGRLETKHTRLEILRQKDIMESQLSIGERNIIESRFFELLDRMEISIEKVKVFVYFNGIRTDYRAGRDALEEIWERLTKDWEVYMVENVPIKGEEASVVRSFMASWKSSNQERLYWDLFISSVVDPLLYIFNNEKSVNVELLLQHFSNRFDKREKLLIYYLIYFRLTPTVLHFLGQNNLLYNLSDGNQLLHSSHVTFLWPSKSYNDKVTSKKILK
jgi:hypothetical protein